MHVVTEFQVLASGYTDIITVDVNNMDPRESCSHHMYDKQNRSARKTEALSYELLQ